MSRLELETEQEPMSDTQDASESKGRRPIPSSSPIPIASPWSFTASGATISHEQAARPTKLLEPFVSIPTSGDSEAGIPWKFSPNLDVGSARARKAAATSSYHLSTSPRSPLSASSLPDPSSSAPRRKSAQFPLAGSPPSQTTGPPSPSPASRRRRRSSASFSGMTSGGAPFGSLVGSFEQSLLSGRLSARPSLPLPFRLSIGVLGSQGAPGRLKCPPHLSLPLDAFFYSSGGADTGSSSTSPYVGTVDIEAHYMSLLGSDEDQARPSSSSTRPRFPGYELPVRGQLQLVLKNPNATAIKLFLVPYDLAGLNRDGLGGKTFLRQKSYCVDRQRLRFAVHLHFCSPPVSSVPGKAPQTKPKAPKYYLHNNLRVVFASRALDSTEQLKIVAECPHGPFPEVVDGIRSHSVPQEHFAPYSGPSNDFEMALRKARAREKFRSLAVSETNTPENQEGLLEVSGMAASPASYQPPSPVLDPNGVDFDGSPTATHAVSLTGTRVGTSTSSSSSSASQHSLATSSPFSFSEMAGTLPPMLPSSALDLVFHQRPDSPVTTLKAQVRYSAKSGLATSRPMQDSVEK